MTLRLNPEERSRLARQILSRLLEESVSASSAQLRGSLAEGGGDRYSDIDVVWEVPDEAFGAALEGMEKALSRVRPLASLRLDPAFQKSDRRRLIFVQFERVPLFWRVDIDLFAASVDDPQYDIDNPRARGDHFARTHSALMNSVGPSERCSAGMRRPRQGWSAADSSALRCRCPPAVPATGFSSSWTTFTTQTTAPLCWQRRSKRCTGRPSTAAPVVNHRTGCSLGPVAG